MKYDLEDIITVAKKTSDKSPCKYKVSCVLVDNRGNIVATGYNHYSNARKMGKWTVHAEVDALNKVRKPSYNLVAFIYRRNSRKINPCEACGKILASYGIKTVYCTNEDSWMLEPKK